MESNYVPKRPESKGFEELGIDSSRARLPFGARYVPRSADEVRAQPLADFFEGELAERMRDSSTPIKRND